MFPVLAAAQDSRSPVSGQVSVPSSFDPEGINIYNKTANLGTITVAEGRFRLKMKEGDTLYFSAVQFELLEVVVNAATLSEGKMQVEIREGLNELPEIVLRPHDLSGNLAEDAKNIEVVDFKIPPMAPLPGPPTGATTTPNAATNSIKGGADLTFIVKLISSLFPKREKEIRQGPLTRTERMAVETEIREGFDKSFFLDHLGLPEAQIGNFLSFSIGENFDRDLLDPDQRMQLIAYLFEKKKQFL